MLLQQASYFLIVFNMSWLAAVRVVTPDSGALDSDGNFTGPNWQDCCCDATKYAKVKSLGEK